MKRRNAELGKIRRPLKRTKITEGMYGNSMLYLRFVMLWATIVMTDYMLEFRFEFLWPFWMMIRSVYDSYKYQGLAFSIFFICIALTSDMICFFFIPVQYIYFAASTYVWVQHVWYILLEKGVCVPTVGLCCAVVYVEGCVRTAERGAWGRPLAAHCVGYPAVTLGVGLKAYLAHRLRRRRQRHVRALNDFYFTLMRDALPDLAPPQQSQPPPVPAEAESTACNGGAGSEARHMNGSVRRRAHKLDVNGHCPIEHANLQFKLDRLEKHLSQQTQARERDVTNNNHVTTQPTVQATVQPSVQASVPPSVQSSVQVSTPAISAPPVATVHAHTHAHTLAHTLAHTHAHTNGSATGAGAGAGAGALHEDEHKHEHNKGGGGKSSKCEKKEATTVKEERRRHKNRDKDRDNNDSHKNTEHTKEHIIKDKDLESTKELKIREHNSLRERERKEERERDREKERERDRELVTCTEELRRVRNELSAARAAESEARRALHAADRQRARDQQQIKLGESRSSAAVTWRASERAALERRLADEKRARAVAEGALQRALLDRTLRDDAERDAARRDLQRATDTLAQLQRDLQRANEQVRSLEALQERALHLERSLSAETRVKLDLLSALGDAKRKMHIQEGMLSRQEKEISELKAQMVAVMPPEFVLDPAAPVYTPRQLASDV